MASATSLQYSQMQLLRHHRIRCVHLVPVLSGNKKSPPQMVSLPCSRPPLWSHGPGLSEDLPVSAVTNETKNKQTKKAFSTSAFPMSFFIMFRTPFISSLSWFKIKWVWFVLIDIGNNPVKVFLLLHVTASHWLWGFLAG